MEPRQGSIQIVYQHEKEHMRSLHTYMPISTVNNAIEHIRKTLQSNKKIVDYTLEVCLEIDGEIYWAEWYNEDGKTIKDFV